jgi:hypothetical protein
MLVQITNFIEAILQCHRFEWLLHQIIDIFSRIPQIIIEIRYFRHDPYTISQTSGQLIIQFLQFNQIGLKVFKV